MGTGDDRKTDIDIMQNVFGGVRISPEDEPPSPVVSKDIRGRPWLTGVTMSSVHVTLANEDDPKDDPKDDKDGDPDR